MADYFASVDYDWEVIIVDDASTDDSLQVAQAFCDDHSNFRVFTIEKGGKPGAIWAGIQDAAGEFVLFTDMDQSAPIQEWEKLFPWFDRGADIVIGSRGLNRDGFNLLRRVGSGVFREIRRRMVLPDIIDTQCGFKACRRAHALELFPHLSFLQKSKVDDGWHVTAFDVELLQIFESAGLDIREVEVRWWDRDRSDTKASVDDTQRYFHESREMLGEIARVRKNKLLGVYKRRIGS